MNPAAPPRPAPAPADDTDPRPSPADTPPVDTGDALIPQVAASRSGGPWLAVGGAVLAGLVVFGWLASHRSPPPKDLAGYAAQPGGAAAPAAQAPVPPELAAAEAASRGTGYTATARPTFVVPTPPPTLPSGSPAVLPRPPGTMGDAALKRRSPALVVDLGAPDTATAPSNATGAPGGPAGKSTLNGDEQFAQRVASDTPEHASATQLSNLPTTIPQGVMIPGVLETALNSDLPGFARAVVSRDVRGFDGRTVLIPRGSRVIGQYRSAAALGASRAFVIWTRIIRPDGASIQIGSSGTDPLGRAGLEGTVDRHFFQRFGGAILLSVVNAGISSAFTRNNNTQVYVGNSQDALGLGSAAQLTNIAPTIKAPQGTPIRIFVARDLDFSGVQPVSAAP